MRPKIINSFLIIFCGFLLCIILFGLSPFQIYGSGSASAQSAPEPPAKPKISIKGGPGDTPETAFVILGAPNSRVGISAEYYALEKKFGRQNAEWKLKRQSVLNEKGKVYDRMEIELKDGSRKTLFFDISEFFGKF